MAIIIVGVVVSIGLSVLDLTIKQLRLTTNSKDSESAFHAANAGMECARHWRDKESNNFETQQNVNISCFGVNNTVTPQTVTVNPNGVGEAFMYNSVISWVTTNGLDRCSESQILIMVSNFNATTTIDNMRATPGPGIIGYPGVSPKKECEPGGRCTVISSRGYSSSCSNITDAGTVQREVLLEL